MKNFEVQHTIRLYDPELIAEIGHTYEAHCREFRNKNEFMTELLRLGVKTMNSVPPKTPASGAAVPPAAFTEMRDIIGKVLELSEETDKYITMQFKKLYVNLEIIERLLSSIYAMQFGELTDEPPLPRKIEDGFFDDLPFRFQNLIVKLEKHYGIA